MQEFLERFSLEYVKFNNEVLFIMILIWLVTLGCGVFSILSQPFGMRQRIAWIVIVTAVPLIGMLIYLPFSFRKEDMPHIFMRRSPRTRRSSQPGKS